MRFDAAMLGELRKRSQSPGSVMRVKKRAKVCGEKILAKKA
jgi:hypothetical protein